MYFVFSIEYSFVHVHVHMHVTKYDYVTCFSKHRTWYFNKLTIM